MHTPVPLQGIYKWLLIGVLFLSVLSGCDALTGPEAPMTRSDEPMASMGDVSESLAAASGTMDACVSGVQSSGATYIFCPPPSPAGRVIIYNHGFQSPLEPPSISDETTDIAALAQGLGFGFAATSYRKSGLAIIPGLADVVDLIGLVRTTYGVTGDILVTGASEGGLITTLLAEQYPDLIAGALPVCSPNGNFTRQVDYFGDFRVLFDYFFPRVLPGNPVRIPAALQNKWETVYAPAVAAAIAAHPGRTAELLKVSQAPVDPNDPATATETVLDLLWYNVFATNDARAVLGGQPYDNTRRVYRGSRNDIRLNRKIKRFKAKSRARVEIKAHYETSGQLGVPVVSLHTTLDPITPVGHQVIYGRKVERAGATDLYSAFSFERYGHCVFEDAELVAALILLLQNTAPSQPLARVDAVLTTPAERQTFETTLQALQNPPSGRSRSPKSAILTASE